VRSPYLAVTVPLAALAAGVTRWLVQGSGNVYTALSKRFYVPDRDLGWRAVDSGALWLGLEVLALIGAVAAGVAAAAWVIRRRERGTGRRWTAARLAIWLAAAVPLMAPVWAFASGGRPDGALDALPAGASAAAPDRGVEGDLGLPAGRYQVVAHAGTSITAHLSAGGEAFDARFTGDVAGSWSGDPRDLTRPTSGDVSVATASVDTGIELRSKHARESYLLADKYPRLTFRLDQIVAARQDAPDLVAFRARGTIGLIGREHPVEVTGTARALDAAGRQRLGLAGDAPAMVVAADLAVVIKDTALAPDAGDFDGDRIPVHASLVLVHQQ